MARKKKSKTESVEVAEPEVAEPEIETGAADQVEDDEEAEAPEPEAPEDTDDFEVQRDILTRAIRLYLQKRFGNGGAEGKAKMLVKALEEAGV